MAVVAFDGQVATDNHQAHAHKKSGQKAGKENRSNRDHAASGQRVDDHHVARRDQQSRRSGGDADSDVEVPIVPFLVHQGDHEPTDRRHGRNRRARNGAEKHAGEDVHVGQATPEAPHEDVGEINQPASNASAAHQGARQDEERNGKKRKTVDAGGDPLRHNFVSRKPPHGQNCHKRGNANAKGDGYVEVQEEDKANDEDEKRNVHSVPRAPKSSLSEARPLFPLPQIQIAFAVSPPFPGPPVPSTSDGGVNLQRRVPQKSGTRRAGSPRESAAFSLKTATKRPSGSSAGDCSDPVGHGSRFDRKPCTGSTSAAGA